MSSFRKKFKVLRKSLESGYYDDDGNWVEGREEEITIKASVQPLNMQETKALTEGEVTMNTVKIYTSTELYTSKEADGGNAVREADVLLWRGVRWRVVACAPYQSGVISHFKAYAQEVGDEKPAKEIYP